MNSILIFFLIIMATGQDITIKYCGKIYSEEEVSQLIHFNKFNQYSFLIGAPITFLCCLFIIVTFCVYPELRKTPGDSLNIISIAEAILSIHWFISALYFIINKKSPLISSNFCQINSFFSILGGTAEFIYNIVFCLQLNNKISEGFKNSIKYRVGLHTISLIIIFIVPWSCYYMGLTGLNIYGTCSFLQNTDIPIFAISLLFIYIIISLYTIKNFQSSVPDIEAVLIQKIKFLVYYRNYLIASTLIWVILAISQLISQADCQLFGTPLVNISISIGNIAKLATPFCLSFLRFYYPAINSKIKKIFHLKKSKLHQSNLQLGDDKWLHEITQSLRNLQIYNILYAIQQQFKPQFSVNEDVSISYKEYTDNNNLNDSYSKHIDILSDKYNFQKKDFLQEETINLVDEQQMQMTVFAPKLFKYLIERDSKMINPFHSLDPEKNIQQINSIIRPDGGKSGEFFFFSSDNKVVLKTISQNEFSNFRDNIVNYFSYILDNDTMISLVYGVYLFVQNQIPTYLIMMRNIAQVEKQYWQSCYDLKGSEFDREVLRKNSSIIEISSRTLKDIDFRNIEQKIYIDSQISEEIKSILIKDAQFFSSSKLIDYSLIIFKIDWEAYIKDHPSQNYKKIQQKFQNNRQIVQSIKEPGIYYQMAIIDYLQDWSTKKLLERTGKIILNADINLDTSAQNPTYYAQRFIDNVVQKIF